MSKLKAKLIAILAVLGLAHRGVNVIDSALGEIDALVDKFNKGVELIEKESAFHHAQTTEEIQAAEEVARKATIKAEKAKLLNEVHQASLESKKNRALRTAGRIAHLSS
jgi:hypothetical protein